MYTTRFYHINSPFLPSLNSSQNHPCPLLSPNLCFPYTHKCGAINCSMGWPIRGQSLEEKWLPIISPHLPITPQLGMGTCEFLLPPCWSSDWFDLVQTLCGQPLPLWVHDCSSPVKYRKHCFTPVLPDLWLLQSSCYLFSACPWVLLLGVWYRCPFCGQVLHRYLFSAFWQTVSFYVYHYQPHKETSLMRSDCCMNGERSFEGSLPLCPFSKVIVNSFLGPMIPQPWGLARF